MPLPFELEGKRVFDLASGFSTKNHVLIVCNSSSNNWSKQRCCSVGDEPTSVLDNRSSPSHCTSTSSLSSSLSGDSSSGVGGGAGGGGFTDTAVVAGVSGNTSKKWPEGHQRHHHQQDSTTTSSGGNDGNIVKTSGGSSGGGMSKNDECALEFRQLPKSIEMGGSCGAEKCGLGGGVEDWGSVLPESAASPGQEQSVLPFIMADGEDSSIGLKQLLPDFDFNGSLGVLDQGFGLNPIGVAAVSVDGNGNNLLSFTDLPADPISTRCAENLLPISVSQGVLSQMQHNPSETLPNLQLFDCSYEKPHAFHPQLPMNQQQAHIMQNPSFFLPLSCNQQQQHPALPKRQPLCSSSPQVHYAPSVQQRQTTGRKTKMAGEEIMQQETIIDQLYKAAELLEAGNSILAHGILARLNQQLSPIGKPFLRAAFYVKEALKLLLINNPSNAAISARLSAAQSPHFWTPFNLFDKISAYKSFSEILPVVHFANFTCNQALLETLEGFNRIHIVDLDIGYGEQWASFMQELSLIKGGAPSLKITSLVSPATHDQLDLVLTQENLTHFAHELNLAFEYQTLTLDNLKAASWSLPLHAADGEAIAVNLPVRSLCNSRILPSLVLRFIKQLSPKIVVSVDRECDRTDLPFPHHILQTFQSYLTLLESLDAVNLNLNALQKIEQLLIQPGIEQIILARRNFPEKMQHWKTLFLTSGFSPVAFSNFAECLAEWLSKRSLASGFHVEKRQSSLVLCWQSEELISASAWRC
ncbi:hypothetical protein Nepgr_023507 [Nepenthes gracilis]|uniref:Scarecrow-like protein 6 n=1 Tax=Nepenthes gracilis TaxID=150966 RepID=A0AAD3T1C4_NEPGR|nr:hypothetical protein Nepgr_023507 [Nepenthes gracilis]